ncbi:MAG: hypothetical protein GXP09_09540 [Gammaproteobacteria bacterium]|nr:hypothetical protein [Gammaproteobacteria bacterium]
MPSLHELQSAFADALLNPDTTRTLSYVAQDKISRDQRLFIYRNHVFSSLTSALQEAYPTIERLVGEAFFRSAARAYIRQHPSTSGDLEQYGDRFADYLDSLKQVDEHAYLPDVARLEWAYHRVYFAADAPALSTESLAKVDPSQQHRLCFGLHPASQLLQSPYPSLRIWQVNQKAYCGDQTVDLSTGGNYLLVLRPQLDPEIHHINHDEYIFLHALSCDKNIADSHDLATNINPEFDLTSCLQKFISNKTLVTFSLEA